MASLASRPLPWLCLLIFWSSPLCAADFPPEVRDARFTAVFVAIPTPDVGPILSIGEFTIHGPERDTLRPLKLHTREAVFVPEQKSYFSIRYGYVYQLDEQVRNPQQIPIDLPRQNNLGLATGMTLDTKRSRLVVNTNNKLVACSLPEKKWSILVEGNPEQHVGLGYSVFSDRLFALACLRGEREGPTLYQLDSAGAVVEQRKLRNAQFVGDVSEDSFRAVIQIVPLREHVLIMTTPWPQPYDKRILKSRLYVVGLKDGSMVETWNE